MNPNLQFAVQIIEALWEHLDRKYTSVTGIPTAWPDEASNHVNHLPHSHTWHHYIPRSYKLFAQE